MIVFETLLLDHQIFGSESVNAVENTFQIRICIFSKESGKNFESHVKSVSFELKIEKEEEGTLREIEIIGTVYFHRPLA